MSEPQRRRQAQKKLARLEIVAKLYKRAYSVRQIRAEVMKRLALTSYSTETVHRDIHTLLDEWRKSRLDDMDSALQLELERIDDTVRELWTQWEKSKEDYDRTTKTRRGAPKKKKSDKDKKDGSDEESGAIETFSIEETKSNVVGLGNPSYIAEIRQQLQERRKLLGLYAPEKKDISGDVSFTSFLVESGLLDEAEQQAKS